MAEKDQKEDQAGEGASTEKHASSKLGVGALLRTEREKKGLSHQQVAEMTRLRRHLIMALEKEEWDELPAPVFVKGFIKSYAKALGLDEKKVLELYEEPPSVEPEMPKLLEPEPRTGRVRFFFPVVILAILAGLIFAWYRYSPREKAEAPIVAQEKPVSRSMEKKQKVSLSQKAPPVEPLEKKRGEEAARPLPQKEKAPPQVQAPLKEEQELPAEEKLGVFPEDKMRAGSALVQSNVQEEKMLVLSGFVKGRTWLSISIDGTEPKEYIFQPGSRPQWKAKQGFDIVVGNAAGIDFDFNGKKISNLGELGQVVRLKLPEKPKETGRE